MAYKPKTILNIGNSVVINGTNGFILYNNNGILGQLSTSSITSLGTLTSLTVSGNITNSALTASKVVFTDANKNLTTTGIGTSAQFIMADGSLNSNTYLTANQTISFSANGDVSGSASGSTSLSPTLTLATITQGLGSSFVKITLDSKGRVTGNTAVGASDITTALGYTPEDVTKRQITMSGYEGSDDDYLSAKAVYDWGTATFAPIGASGLTVGTSEITGGTNTKVLYNNSGVLGEYGVSGSGSVVMTISPTIQTSLTLSYATASTIAIFDASKNLISAATGTYPSLTELSFVKGVTAGIQTQINNKQDLHANLTALAGLTYASRAFVYMNASGSFALDTSTYISGNQTITLSGDASGSGATSISVSISNATVTGKLLTGYVSGAGTVAATDSILQAIQKLNGNIAALVTGVSSVNGSTGAVTLTTTNISEGTNLYYTNARVDTRVAAYTGDVTLSGTTFSIGSNKVTNAMLSTVSTATFHGRVTAGTGNVENLTGTQATTLLDTFTSSLKGLAPASGGGTTNFLRADGTWAAPSGGSSYTFSTGLTNTSSTITANLSTGVSGGQSVIGGTASGNSLTLSSTSHATKGTIIFGTSAYDEANNRLGLFTTTPTHKVEVVAGTLTDGQSALRLTATMPTTITATNTAFDIQITSAGSSSFQNRAVNIDYLAGYTGSQTTSAYNATNSVAGTGNDFLSVRNQGAFVQANATTIGSNVGAYGSASNGNQNAGVLGRAITAKNSATNIAVVGFALNTGTSPVQVGGFFGLMNTVPSFTSAALMADNGNTTDPIFVLRDNGSNTLTVIDGGNVGLFQSTPTSRLHINFNQNSVTQSDANGILLANSTAAINGTQSISPPIVWQGNGWSTGSSASQDVRFRADVLPVQSSNANATWRLAYSLNGAAYSNAFTVDTVGAINFALAASFSSSVTVSGVLIQSNFRASTNNAYQSTQFLVGLADTATQSYRTTNAGSDVNTRLLCVYNNSNSTSGTLGIVADAVNGLMFTAANGTRMIARAAITIGNLTNTAGSEAGDLLLHTQSGGTAYSQKMRISGLGNIVLGNEAALSTSATDNFVYIPTCAGTPTGVPTAYTGKVAMVYDTTNNKYYIYNGGWKSVTLT